MLAIPIEMGLSVPFWTERQIITSWHKDKNDWEQLICADCFPADPCVPADPCAVTCFKTEKNVQQMK